VADAPEGRVRRALHAEWTKLRTLPSTGWLLAAIAVLTVLVGTAGMAATSTSQCVSPTACQEDLAKLSLSGIPLGQAAVVVLGVLVMAGEYGTGTIRTTLTAMPRRGVVFAAKSAVLAGVAAAAGAAGVLGSALSGRLILPANGFTSQVGYPPLSLADGPTLRATGGSVLYLVLIGLLSMGVGAAVRDSGAAITVVLGLLYVFPITERLITDPVWRERIQRLTPMQAGLAIQATRNVRALPIGPWPGLGVLAVYAAAALAAGAVLFRVRDA
jgi:ABC-type transport system involved in multi-copper enzyme maturation permease subunit